MIITCKNCRTSYHVARTNMDGRQLRCTKCKHQWVYKDKALIRQVKHDALYLTAVKPEKAKFRVMGLWIFSIPILMLAFMVMASIISLQTFWRKYVPMIVPYYESVGAHSAEGCELHSTYAVKIESGMIINGVVENTSSFKRKIPPLLIRILYKNASTQTILIPAPEGYLVPEEKYFFNQQIKFSEDTEAVSVEIMDGIQAVFYKLFEQ